MLFKYCVAGCLALAGAVFLLSRAAIHSTEASEPVQTDLAAAAKAGFGEVSVWLTKSADMVPADKYSYRPVGTIRTFGELMGHVADGYGFYCGRAAGRNTEWSDAISKGPTDKATIVRKLKEATDACTSASLTQPMHFMAGVVHANLHYGNAIVYLRMLGLVPPSSS